MNEIKFHIFQHTGWYMPWDQFKDLNAQIVAAMELPQKGTTNYAEPLLHANPLDLRVAMPVTEDAAPFFTADELANLWTIDDLQADGWFPAPARARV